MALPPDFISKLELFGEDEVRSKLAAGVFSGRKVVVAEEWLAGLERSREAESSASSIAISRERVSVAREANDLARQANARATIALAIATIAAITAIVSIILSYNP